MVRARGERPCVGLASLSRLRCCNSQNRESDTMKRGLFEPAAQAGGAEQPYRRGNFSCAYEWLEGVEGVDALLQVLDALSAADAQHRYLCTLDDINQCSYTCGHAGQDDRLYLEEPDDEEEGGIDWDESAQEAAWEQASLQHRLAQLNNPDVAQSWNQVCGTLSTSATDVKALLQANHEPDALLDEVVYVQRIPVTSDDLMIAAQPNGYFSADWDTFQNHAIIRHLATQYGYRFFGMGASWMGFVRPAPPSADQCARLVADLKDLYGRKREEVFAHAGWAELQQLLQGQRLLMLGYVENMAESLGLEDED